MASVGEPDRLLTRILARATTDLERYRRAATTWHLVDVFLLVPAAVGTAGAALLGATGFIEVPVAVGAALVSALLAGLSVLLDIPARTRRAQVAAAYLGAFVAEARDLPDWGEEVVDLRGWFVRINAAIALHETDLDSELLEPPCLPGSGHCAPAARVEEDAGPVLVEAEENHHIGTRGGERAGARHMYRLRWAFVLAIAFLAIEGMAAFYSNSLSLLSDAGHVLTDAVGLGMALAAVHLASRGSRDPSRTFGMYRLEIVAALTNAILLLGVAGYVLVEAVRRLADPPEVPGTVVMLVAVAGLVANLISYFLLRPGAAESLNVRAAYLEVLADAIASVGVLVSGLALHVT
ncbi:MAG: cation diffusion facilitator family transporter, partial [Acidimicrobiia bacterium]